MCLNTKDCVIYNHFYSSLRAFQEHVAYEKLGEYGDPQSVGVLSTCTYKILASRHDTKPEPHSQEKINFGMKQLEAEAPEMTVIIRSLEQADGVRIKWKHDYVTKDVRQTQHNDPTKSVAKLVFTCTVDLDIHARFDCCHHIC